MTAIDALKEVLRQKVGDVDARRHMQAVYNEVQAAQEVWSDTQVRTRNIIAGVAFLAGLAAGYLVG